MLPHFFIEKLMLRGEGELNLRIKLMVDKLRVPESVILWKVDSTIISVGGSIILVWMMK